MKADKRTEPREHRAAIAMKMRSKGGKGSKLHEIAEKFNVNATTIWLDVHPEKREAVLERVKRNYDNKTDEQKEARRNKANEKYKKKYREDPVFRQLCVDNNIRNRKKTTKYILNRYHSDPVFRKKIIERAKMRHKINTFKTKMLKQGCSQEVIDKRLKSIDMTTTNYSLRNYNFIHNKIIYEDPSHREHKLLNMTVKRIGHSAMVLLPKRWRGYKVDIFRKPKEAKK